MLVETPYFWGVINPKTYLNHDLGSKFFFLSSLAYKLVNLLVFEKISCKMSKNWSFIKIIGRGLNFTYEFEVCYRWAVTLARVSITGIPPCFLSLDTSLDIKTVISKVSIPVSISRLKISESRFQSRYQDSNFKSLDSSLNIKTQLWKVSILVSMSRLDSWIYNRCPNLDTGSAKQKILENAT